MISPVGPTLSLMVSVAFLLIDGYAVIYDYFALSGCHQIIQMSEYSTFSIAAAIIGQVQLINFLPE